jgi:hypothetical protein
MDAIEEPAFAPGVSDRDGPHWLNLPEIPPVFAARMRVAQA